MSSDARIRWSADLQSLTASHDGDGTCGQHPRESHKYDLVNLLEDLERCLGNHSLCWEPRVKDDGTFWLAGYLAR